MNKKLHRIVFNRARGLWMAVAETAAAQGKDAGRLARSASPCVVTRHDTLWALERLVGALLLALAVPTGQAQIVADPSAPRTQQPTVLNAANDVPLVNIQTPSAAGVSRNTYRQFDVSGRGAILNNSRTDTPTQLGGWVQGNPWLAAGGARVILNEVNASAPSQLRGYVEVAGQRAEVVIANPAGIEVAGGGFINANRVTLTTGTPVLAGGALEGYRVQGGLVRIEGAGLDTSSVDYTQVLGRAVELNAAVWARELEVVAGAHQYDAARGQAHAAASAQRAPAVALDVAQLGGMYAGKIRLVGTEAGLGVRNAGTVAATQGELVVDANGWLSNTGTLQSAAGARIHASQTLSNQGTVAAQDGLRVRAPELDNRGGILASVQGDVDVAAARIDNAGGRLLAGRNVLATAGHLVNADGHVAAAHTAQLRSHEQALDNQGGLITAQHSASIDAAGMNNTGGAVHSGGSLTIDTRGNLLDNRNAAVHPQGAGGVVAAGALTLRTGELDNRSGLVASGGALQIEAAGLVHNGSGPVAAGGELLSQQTLTLIAGQWDNRGGIAEAAGDVRVQASNGLDNTVGLVRSGAQLTVQAGAVVNADTARGDQGLEGHWIDLRAARLDNRAGALRATQQATLEVSGVLDNTAGLLSAGQTLALTGGAVHNEDGTLLAGARLDAQAGTLHGSGRALSQGDLRLAVSGAFQHTGELAANGTLALHAGALANHGRIQAGEQLLLQAASLDNSARGDVNAPTASVQVRDTLTNRGLIDGTTVRIEAGELHNLGTGRLYGDHLSLQAGRLVNDTETVDGVRRDAVIAARERLDIGTQHLLNRHGALIFSAGDLAIGGGLDAQGRATATAQLLENRSATLESMGDLHLAATQVQNTNDHFQTELREAERLTRRVIHEVNGKEYTNADVIYARFRKGDRDGQDLWTRDDNHFYVTSDPVGGVSDKFMVLPSQTYPFDVFGPANGVHRVPVPAYEPPKTEFSGDGVVTTQEQYRYGVSSREWDLFGVRKPDSDPPPNPGTCSVDDYACGLQLQAYESWKARNHSLYLQLNEKIAAFEADVRSRLVHNWTFYKVDEVRYTPVVTHSEPGRILAGGNAHVEGSVLNDRSQIIVGGDLTGSGSNIDNRAAEGIGVQERQGASIHTYISGPAYGHGDRDYTPPAPYHSRVEHTVTLPATELRTRTTPTGTGTQLAAHAIAQVTRAPALAGAVQAALPAPSVGPLPSNSLFRVQPEATAGYLIETDPRFADHRQWLASDYMLRQLALDPAMTQKRLGDGFYEQRLVREQIGQLTGRRFLEGYASDEAQYRALMDAGVTFAREHRLRPGVALTAEQVAQLTSDIVWLVERSVTLADGSTQRVLVPQVYLRPRPEDLGGSGTLISADRIGLELAGELVNSGTIAGRRVVALDAQQLRNLGGRIAGQDVALSAQQDLLNLGGRIEAGASLHLAAGRDLTVASTTRSTATDAGRGSHYERTTLDRLAGLYVTSPGGTMVASAGRDLALQAAEVRHDGAGGTTVLAAGRDMTLGTVQLAEHDHIVWDRRNWKGGEREQELGTQVQAAGHVTLAAGRDLTARAASVSSEQGALVAQAGRDLALQAGFARQLDEEAHYFKQKGLLSSKRTTTHDRVEHTGAQGTSFSGATVHLAAGQDLAVVGSHVASDRATTLVAGRDVTIQAATETLHEHHFKETKKSGVFTSGASLTFGKQQHSTDAELSHTTARGATVGSVEGHVLIQAGGAYRQTGSDVLTPGGDVTVVAQSILVDGAREEQQLEQTTKFRQSGLSVAVSSPVISAAQGVAQMSQAGAQVGDPRLQALAAGSAALSVREAAQSISQSPQTGGGFTVSLTVGGAKSDSQLTQSASGTRASIIEAAGHVKLIAAGAGEDSHLTLRGSDVSAAGQATLLAEGNVTLQSQAQSVQQHSTERSSSAGVGLALTYGQSGWAAGFTANASAARGHADGQDLTHRHTEVKAGQSATLISGGDTTLSGAQVSGERIVAQVGGDLTIHSVQDTATYDSRHRSAGGSVTLGYGFAASASYSQARVEADHASVSQQSGLRAGDQGFQVEVKGHTELQGALIASTQAAVDAGRNRLATGTLSTQDLTNRSEHEARGISLSGGFSYGGSGKQGSSEGASANSPGSTSAPASPSSGVALQQFQTGSQGAAAGYVSDSSQRTSTTRSGISGGEVVITDAVAQQERTGQTAEQTLAAVNRDVLSSTEANGLSQHWDGQKLQKQVQAGAQIVATFGQQASKAVGDYAEQKREELKLQAWQAEQAGDDQAAARLREEAARWDEGGTYHVVMHTLTGGLSGGLQGALGAGAAAQAAPLIEQITAELPLSEPLQAVAGLMLSSAIGAATGGPGGASQAFTVDANNRSLHNSERKMAIALAKEFDGRYSVEEIEAQLRQMPNVLLAQSGAAARYANMQDPHTQQRWVEERAQDPNLPIAVQGNSIVERQGSANGELQALIVGATTFKDGPLAGHSPYLMSPQAARDLLSQAASGSPSTSAPRYFDCANTTCLTYGANYNPQHPANQAEIQRASDMLKAAGVIISAPALVAALATPQGQVAVQTLLWNPASATSAAAGAGANAAVQYGTTGTVDPAGVVVSGVTGAVGGGSVQAYRQLLESSKAVHAAGLTTVIGANAAGAAVTGGDQPATATGSVAGYGVGLLPVPAAPFWGSLIQEALAWFLSPSQPKPSVDKPVRSGE